MTNLPDGYNLNGVVIKNYIGSGSFGDVYKTLMPNNVEAALKIFNGAEEDDYFKNENKIMQTLKTHPRIIEPYSEVIQHDKFLYYLMELADLKLGDFLNLHEADLSTKDKILLFLEICSGLNHAHNRSVAHRDLWWDNILLKLSGGENEPKITDFGRAKDFDLQSMSTDPGGRWGHRAYIRPPEAYFWIHQDDKTYSYIRADLYALGIILSFLFKPFPPGYTMKLLGSIEDYFRTNNYVIKDLSVDRRKEIYQDWIIQQDKRVLDGLKVETDNMVIDGMVNKVIFKLVDYDRDKRYNNVEEVIIELNNINELC